MKNLFKKLISSAKGLALLVPMSRQSESRSKGFTLIELLIVIAVLGVLATVILVVLDPVEQLARSRDAGRKSTVDQLGGTLQAYYTTRAASATPFPTANATWITSLQAAGEIKTIPPSVSGGTACTTNVQNSTWCYTTNNTNAAAWARLESKSESSKCAAGNNPYFVWDSSRGSTCLVCKNVEPAIGDACNATQ